MLHLPGPGKNLLEFGQAITDQIASRCTDFRYLPAPGPGDASFCGAIFAAAADFSEVVIPGALDFTGARFQNGLLLRTPSELRTVSFVGAEIHGSVSFSAKGIGHLNGGPESFGHDLLINIEHGTANLYFSGCAFHGRVSLRGTFQDLLLSEYEFASTLDLSGCHLNRSLVLGPLRFGPNADIDLSGANVVEQLTIEAGPMPRQ